MPRALVPPPGPPGDRSFLVCACQSPASQLGMWPVLDRDAVGPFICALVCPGCATELPIPYGRLAPAES